MWTTELHTAARYGSRDTIEKLLAEKIDLNTVDEHGRTPLSYAASGGNHEKVKLLIQADGIRLNAQDKNGRTPLSYAVLGGHHEAVELMIQADGIDLDTQDKYGQTPLWYAASGGHDKIVQLLIQADNINLNIQDMVGRTPLSYAASGGHKKIVKLLIQADGIILNIQDNNGRTPLCDAVLGGHEEIVELLIQADGIILNTQDEIGRTPLSYAASGGHTETVRLLIQAGGIRLNTQDIDGRTPLSYAALRGHEETVKLLIQADSIDLYAQDKDGKTPLLLAADQVSIAVVRMLAESASYPDRTVLSWAAEHGHTTTVRRLLQLESMDPSSKDPGGQTPLSRALDNGHEAAVELLASVDATTPHTLVREGQKDKIQRLLKLKISANGRDSRQQTPLHIAILYGHTDIVKVLIAFGADINSERSDGLTPLRLAILRKDVESIEVLLQKGVKVEGVLAEEWLDAYNKGARDVRVELSEGAGSMKYLRFDERNWVDRLASLGTSRHLLSAYPYLTFEANSIAQSLFSGCPEILKYLKSTPADTSTLRIISGEGKTKDHIFICVGVRYPIREAGNTQKRFHVSWVMCAIAWTIIPPAKSKDGPNWESIAHISMLPNGWIPNDGPDFFQQLVLYLKERWIRLCDEAEEHLSSQRLNQLQSKGSSPDLIQHLAEDAEEWDRLRRILKQQVLTAEEFATKHVRQYNPDDGSKVQEAIGTLSNEVGNRLHQLDQTVKDLLQFEFAWVSINEAHRSISIATSMKRLSWITFVFLPAMFTSSLFGMNVNILATNPDWRWFILFVSTILAVTIVGWLLFKYGQVERWIERHIGRRLERWGNMRKDRTLVPGSSKREK